MTVTMPMAKTTMMTNWFLTHIYCVVKYNLSFSFPVFRDRRWIVCIGFLLGSMMQGHAQQSDFQFWPQVQIGYNLSGRFKLSLTEEVRFRENVSQVKKELTDVGITFKINKALRLGISYRLELDFKNPDESAWRNGLYGDIMFRQKIQRFQFDYRLRFQSARIESISEVSSLNQWMTNRHKASLQYNIRGIPLTPVIEAEIFIPIRKQDPLMIDGYRLWAGLAYALNKRNEISLRFGIQQEVNVADPWREYILGVGYSLDIN
jgi:hypothetical protein